MNLGGRASRAALPSGNWQEMLEKTLEEWQAALGEVLVVRISLKMVLDVGVLMLQLFDLTTSLQDSLKQLSVEHVPCF